MGDTEPEKPVDAWGQPISEERQAELRGYLERWEAETDHGERIGPFYGVYLTGADVFWLVEQAGRDEIGDMPLHLERVRLAGAHLEEAYLSGVHLEGAQLRG